VEIKSLETFDGVSVGNKLVLQLLMRSVGIASSIVGVLPDSVSHELKRITMLSAMHTANSLLMAAHAKCTLAAPPADIDVLSDASTGQLIYRCEHPNPHKWNMNGERI
jgi:hypothetical protein